MNASLPHLIAFLGSLRSVVAASASGSAPVGGGDIGALGGSVSRKSGGGSPALDSRGSAKRGGGGAASSAPSPVSGSVSDAGHEGAHSLPCQMLSFWLRVKASGRLSDDDVALVAATLSTFVTSFARYSLLPREARFFRSEQWRDEAPAAASGAGAPRRLTPRLAGVHSDEALRTPCDLYAPYRTRVEHGATSAAAGGGTVKSTVSAAAAAAAAGAGVGAIAGAGAMPYAEVNGHNGAAVHANVWSKLSVDTSAATGSGGSTGVPAATHPKSATAVTVTSNGTTHRASITAEPAAVGDADSVNGRTTKTPHKRRLPGAGTVKRG
mgnify:CR=1 FL=1